MYELFERDPKLGPPGFVENMAYYFPEDSERLQNLVARAVEYGEEFECDLHIRLSNGREAWHHTIARVEKDESGKVIGLYQSCSARPLLSNPLAKSSCFWIEIKACLDLKLNEMGYFWAWLCAASWGSNEGAVT